MLAESESHDSLKETLKFKVAPICVSEITINRVLNVYFSRICCIFHFSVFMHSDVILRPNFTVEPDWCRIIKTDTGIWFKIRIYQPIFFPYRHKQISLTGVYLLLHAQPHSARLFWLWHLGPVSKTNHPTSALITCWRIHLSAVIGADTNRLANS